MTLLIAIQIFAATVSISLVRAAEDDSSQKIRQAQPSTCFLIGNSLTWDTVPPKLDGNPKWHVDCGKSLPFIVANPEAPCVKTSTLWPRGLREGAYDFVVLQVHYGSTLDQDFKAISTLIQLQPDAKIVVHTGWARAAERIEEWESSGSDQPMMMMHNQAYFSALLDRLEKQFPDRTFSRTRAMEMLQQVEADIQSGICPLSDVKELYRDAIHMNVMMGRYLMHNAVRAALEQPRSNAGFDQLDPELRRYFDSVLDRVLASPGHGNTSP